MIEVDDIQGMNINDIQENELYLCKKTFLIIRKQNNKLLIYVPKAIKRI
ncbi:MAG: hypothetical protein QXO37_06945 [Candidatus Nitrosocaldaceae archaeon]